MIKNVIKQHYGLVDPANKAELEAALAAFETENEVPAKDNFGAALLEDGETMIFFPGDVFVDGSPVYEDAEGTTPLADGEHVLENGDIIVVAEGIGILQPAIADEEAPAEEEVPEEEAPIVPEEEVLAEPGTPGSPSSVKETTTTTTETNFNAEETVSEEVAENFNVEQMFTALQPIFDKIDERFNALEGKTTETEASTEELSETVEKLSKVSAAAPYTEQPAQKKSFKKQSAFERLASKRGYKVNENK